MKRSFNLLGLAFVLACATAPQVAPNRYGLRVVPDVRTYQQIVAHDTNQRLVDLQSFIPGIVLDIRYATTNNFMHEQLYPLAKAFLRYPAATALRDAERELAGQNLGLKIFDAYRPYSITERMWEPIKNADFVADPAKGSRHNRGAAVDLTLIDLRSGQELPMPSNYDEFSERAYRKYTGGTPQELANRQLLEDTMKRHGFLPLPSEWWHFDYETWQQFDLMDVKLEDLASETRDHR